MTITGVTGTTAMSSASLEPHAGLDGETLLAYCAMQLNDINGEIKGQLARQQAARNAKAGINQIKTLLNAHSKEGAFTYEQKLQILSTYAETIKNMPTGSARDTLVQSLQSFRKTACNNNIALPPMEDIDAYTFKHPDGRTGITVDAGAGGDSPASENERAGNALDENELSSFQKDLSDLGDEINKNADLDMIGLQQLISQRQMAVQMTTSMMQKFNQTLEAVVGNLK